MSLDRAECERVLKLVSTEFADQHVLLSDGTSELLLKTTDGTKHPTWANMHYLARLLRQALAELDATERDAERYRWLRTPRFGTQTAVGVPFENMAGGRSVYMKILSEAELDAAIDAAIEQTKGG